MLQILKIIGNRVVVQSEIYILWPKLYKANKCKNRSYCNSKYSNNSNINNRIILKNSNNNNHKH